jgi:hypothetical protein
MKVMAPAVSGSPCSAESLSNSAERRLGDRLHRALLPALLSPIGVASPERLDACEVPGAVRLAADPTRLGSAHPDVSGELPITGRAHPYTGLEVKS